MSLNLEETFSKKYSRSWQNDLFTIWRLSKPYSWRLLGAILCSLSLSGINGGIAWAVKPALDNIFISRSSPLLVLLPLGVVVLFFLRGTFTYLTNYLMNSVCAKIVRFLRQEIYHKLLYLPLSFHNRTPSGSITSRMLNDLNTLQNMVGFTIKDFFVEGGTVIILAAIAFYRKWDLALLSFIVIPLILYSIGTFGRRMKRTSTNTRLLLSKITTILQESLQGIKIIKAFTMEKEMSKRNENALAEHYRNVMREVRINGFSSFAAELFGGIGVAIILFYGGHLVVSGKMSTGSFFSFIAAILMIYTPLKRLSGVHNSFQQASSIIDRIRDLVDVEKEKRGGIEKVISGKIVFRDISFKYPAADTCSIENISFEINPGDIVALVGYSGAGKSTIADLIAGFWHPDKGNILIDGTEAGLITGASLRGSIGIVTQDVILFDDTIKANILFGRQGAGDEEVIKAAKAAYAHEFIMELPEGYETIIGERGARLSGGQKQRITIARAILRDPKILVLDEATSSLDVESEQKIQKALEGLMEGRTTIVIAHRLSTIKKAAKIIVLSRGKIIQQGTHEELLRQNGMYQELYTMQFAHPESKLS